MLDPIIFDFLKELEQNNNREWFTENKKYYIEANNAVKTYVEKMIDGVSSFDKDIVGLEAKQCIFRIYRDVRFSKDKTPYKEHFANSYARLGKE